MDCFHHSVSGVDSTSIHIQKSRSHSDASFCSPPHSIHYQGLTICRTSLDVIHFSPFSLPPSTFVWTARIASQLASPTGLISPSTPSHSTTNPFFTPEMKNRLKMQMYLMPPCAPGWPAWAGSGPYFSSSTGHHALSVLPCTAILFPGSPPLTTAPWFLLAGTFFLTFFN